MELNFNEPYFQASSITSNLTGYQLFKEQVKSTSIYFGDTGK